jgi:hypothetical protein
MQLRLLNNKKNTQHKELTKPIVFSYRFLQALFEIESNFDDKDEKFAVRNNGQGRLKNHLTKADLQLATTLQVGMNVKGESNDLINRHRIYLKLDELFEDPINKDQFYAAFQKFVLHGLILVKKDDITGQYLYKLQNYLEPDTDKIGRFVIFPAYVYTKAFTDQPLAAQKFMYYACGQQGEERHKIIERNFDGLIPFLHKTEPHQIRDILQKLTNNNLIEGQPIFSFGQVIKNAVGGWKARFQVNAKLLPIYTPQTEYHEAIPARKNYLRLFRKMEEILSYLGVDEFINFQNGIPFKQLAHLLKDKSYTYIRYILERIQKLHKEHRFFPENIIEYVKKDLHDKSTSILLTISQRTGVYGFIAPGYKPNLQERFTQFTSSLKDVPTKALRRACKAASVVLLEKYTRPSVYDHKDYLTIDHPLEKKINLLKYRYKAYHLKLDPESFLSAVDKAYYQLNGGKTIVEVESWLTKTMLSLPKWKLVPDPPEGFILENFLQPFIKQQLS